MAPQPQPNPDRTLSELVHLCQASDKSLEIVFLPNSPVRFPVNGVELPHPWRVRIRPPHRSETEYIGWGVTINDAIVDCHRHWQNGEPL